MPQGLQHWKSVFNLQEVKTPFPAISPLPPGSDDAALPSFRLAIVGRTPVTVWLFILCGEPVTDKNSEEDAGIDEGYGEPKEKVQLAGVALRKPCFCQQANGRRSGYSLHTPCPTLRSYCILVSKCVSSSQPDQYRLHFPGGTEASRRAASRG